MRRHFLFSLLAAFAVIAMPLVPPAYAGEERAIGVPSADAEMNNAIREACANLPEFWKAMAKPGPGETSFSLKVRITDKGQAEHFWLDTIERKGGKLSGVITNTPQLVKNVQRGQRYEFEEAAISDWLYVRNGKWVGNRTMRVLLKRLPKAEADRFAP